MTHDRPNLLIGAMATHDDATANNRLAEAITDIYGADRSLFDRLHWLTTGGTFQRVVNGVTGTALRPLAGNVAEAFRQQCTVLPSYINGGVVAMSNLVVQGAVQVVALFLTPKTVHFCNPENQALIRIGDVVRTKYLMNSRSLIDWFNHEAPQDVDRFSRSTPPVLSLPGDVLTIQSRHNRGGGFRLQRSDEIPRGPKTIALVANEEMKPRLREFVADFEEELGIRFPRIIATASTGRMIRDAFPSLRDRVICLKSGKFGGDLNLALAVIYNQVDTIVFFPDRITSPQPHEKDIDVVIGSAMRSDSVRLLTNERAARSYMENLPKIDDKPAHAYSLKLAG